MSPSQSKPITEQKNLLSIIVEALEWEALFESTSTLCADTHNLVTKIKTGN
jgi:hypothetical protein